jgi:predicted nucleotidyltransferase
LEDNLGSVVDVTTRDSLDPGLRGRIEASAVRVFHVQDQLFGRKL